MRGEVVVAVVLSHHRLGVDGGLPCVVVVQQLGNDARTGAIKTLFALRDPDTDEQKWLSWLTDVDIAVASKTDKDEQRFYYSGDGKPKVSNYELATTGAAPYPVGYYDLGLAPPDDALQLTTTAGTFTEKTTTSYARDAANIVTIVTSAVHGLRTGNSVSVSGFSYINGTYTQTGSTRTGTYSQSSGTLSLAVVITDHGLQTGMVTNLQFSADTTINGAYSVSVIDKDTFAITAPVAAARSGNITWTNSGTTTIQVTITTHGLSNGAQVTLDFTSGTAADGTYTVTNVATNTFDIITTVPNTTSGTVKWDIRNLNATNVECTVTNPTTFTYFSPLICCGVRATQVGVFTHTGWEARGHHLHTGLHGLQAATYTSEIALIKRRAHVTGSCQIKATCFRSPTCTFKTTQPSTFGFGCGSLGAACALQAEILRVKIHGFAHKVLRLLQSLCEQASVGLLEGTQLICLRGQQGTLLIR